MAGVIYRVAGDFKFFGTTYHTGDTIDTTGWPPHRIDQLLKHEQVYLDRNVDDVTTLQSDVTLAAAFAPLDIA